MGLTNAQSSFFKLKLKFNGQEFEKKTDDIKSFLKSIKPFHLKSNINFYCENSKGEVHMSVILAKRARMIWRNDTYMDMFINKLIFKKNV